MVAHENQNEWVAFEQALAAFEGFERTTSPKFGQSVRRRPPLSPSSRVRVNFVEDPTIIPEAPPAIEPTSTRVPPPPPPPPKIRDPVQAELPRPVPPPPPPIAAPLSPSAVSRNTASKSSKPRSRSHSAQQHRESVELISDSDKQSLKGQPKSSTLVIDLLPLPSVAASGRDHTASTSTSESSATMALDTEARAKPMRYQRDDSLSANTGENFETDHRGRVKARSSSRDEEETKHRARSVSQAHDRSKAKSSSHRGRSSSRSRPPKTSNNPSRERSRSRSASVTRVTTAASSGRHPPSTSRTLWEMRRASSTSFGSGQRQLNDSDPSIAESQEAILDIAVELSTLSSTGKKAGLMERLFGDHVEKPFPTSVTGDFLYDIRPRILLAATVYHNTATNLWIATINTNQRGVAKNPATANKHLKAFSFSSEIEARESAIANAPPKMVPFSDSQGCFICKGKFAVFRRASHCRNCGVCICNSCCTTWSAKSVPSTYNQKNENSVKICLSCDSLSSCFKEALLGGDLEGAMAIYETGNINLRTPFPAANKKDEIMYPVHCAVEGGNISLLRWLLDDHFCPIKLVRSVATKKAKKVCTDILIMTSKGRTVLSIAIEKMKVDILRYLVIESGVSIYESTDLTASLRVLEQALYQLPDTSSRNRPRDRKVARWDTAFDDVSESSMGDHSETSLTIGSRSNRTRNSRSSRTGDSCIICFERKIDCVATPCGHQVCCLECSASLSACPVCNNRGEFIKIFRP